jgi:hypothetical protein
MREPNKYCMSQTAKLFFCLVIFTAGFLSGAAYGFMLTGSNGVLVLQNTARISWEYFVLLIVAIIGYMLFLKLDKKTQKRTESKL